MRHGFQEVYRNGDLGWMSHFGPQAQSSFAASYISLGMRNQVEPISSGHLIVTTRYLDQLIHEEIAELVTPEDRIHLTHRTWHREGSALTRDRLEVFGEAPRELSFKYDAQDRLVERSVWSNQRLIARHKWTRSDAEHHHPACSINSYVIGHDQFAMIEEGTERLFGVISDPEINQSVMRRGALLSLLQILTRSIGLAVARY